MESLGTVLITNSWNKLNVGINPSFNPFLYLDSNSIESRDIQLRFEWNGLFFPVQDSLPEKTLIQVPNIGETVFLWLRSDVTLSGWEIEVFKLSLQSPISSLFTITKGDKGEDGEQGIQGLKGDQGEPGLKGDKGDKGDSGEGSNSKVNFISGTEALTGKWFEYSSGLYRPIYRKTFNFGSLSGGSKAVSHGLNWNNLHRESIRLNAIGFTANNAIPVPYAWNSGPITMEITNTQLIIYLGANYSSYTGVVDLEYAKTTDQGVTL